MYVYTCRSHFARSVRLTSCSKTLCEFVCSPKRERDKGVLGGFKGACVCVWGGKAIGAKKERAGRGIVTFVHLSFWLSGAVITATEGSLLCLGLSQRAKSAVNGKTVGEFGKTQFLRRDHFALSPHR